MSTVCAWSKVTQQGVAAHHLSSPDYPLLSLSNKEGQCARHILSLFETPAGLKGDMERWQIVVACLSPIHPPHTDKRG